MVAQKKCFCNTKAQKYCDIISVQEEINAEPVDDGAEENKEMPEEMGAFPLQGEGDNAYGIDEYEFSTKIGRNKYDVIAIDEIPLDAEFNRYVDKLQNYAKDNNATVIFAFTPSRKMKHYKDAQKFVDNMECLGKVVYRYSTVAPHILQPLKYTAKLEDSDEQLISTLIEMLGII